jgi:hypothetical protein
VLRPAVLIFTVKRSLTDRGFLASIHFARPLALVQGAGSEGGSGRLEVRYMGWVGEVCSRKVPECVGLEVLWVNALSAEAECSMHLTSSVT